MSAKTSKKHILTQERRSLVMRLRKSGAIYEDIVKAVIEYFKKNYSIDELPKNYNVRQAHQDVVRELAKLQREVREGAEDVKAIEAMRLESLFYKNFLKVQKNNDPRAAEICLKIHDRIMRLWGLDVQKIMPIGKDGEPLGINVIVNPNGGILEETGGNGGED